MTIDVSPIFLVLLEDKIMIKEGLEGGRGVAAYYVTSILQYLGITLTSHLAI